MYKYLFVFLLFLTANNIYGQRNLKTLDGSAKRSNTSRNMGTDSLYDRGTKKIAKNTKAKIEDYKIISRKGDTTHVDTTLTIQKEYKFNYLRRDYFELLPFNNMGQTYNTLSHNMSSQDAGIDMYPIIYEMMQWSKRNLKKKFGPKGEQWLKETEGLTAEKFISETTSSYKKSLKDILSKVN